MVTNEIASDIETLVHFATCDGHWNKETKVVIHEAANRVQAWLATYNPNQIHGNDH